MFDYFEIPESILDSYEDYRDTRDYSDDNEE